MKMKTSLLKMQAIILGGSRPILHPLFYEKLTMLFPLSKDMKIQDRRTQINTQEQHTSYVNIYFSCSSVCTINKDHQLQVKKGLFINVKQYLLIESVAFLCI